MSSRTASAIRVCVVVAFITVVGAGVLLAQATTRASVGPQGQAANGSCWVSAISTDGRFESFESDATNLVPDDTNAVTDVFLHDRQTGKTMRVSVSSRGEQANGVNYGGASLSADGRFVTFSSWATNLVPGDTNAGPDVFVHDRETGETTLMSVDSTGTQANGWCASEAISADGRFVAFSSWATNLVPGDANHSTDVFVHDRQTGATTRVSVDSLGIEGDGPSEGLSVSADGRFVAFSSWATNLVSGDTNQTEDVFLHDRQTGDTTRVSVDSLGVQAVGRSSYPDISADGGFVAFASEATNLVAGDTNGYWDSFVHDRQTGVTSRVNVSSQGAQANGASPLGAHLSADGRFAALHSEASNLVSDDTNDLPDIFVHDRQTGDTTRVSLDWQGGQGIDASFWFPEISADGRFVTFASKSLVPGDHLALDIYVRDRIGPCALPASWTSYGSGWTGTSGVPGLIARSNPVLCGTLEVFADNSSGMDTSGLLLAGFTSASIVTTWGGTVLVLPALVMSLGMPAAGLSITAPIPCDDSLCGLTMFVQLVEMDPGASRGVSFTPGIELRLGVQ